jgi:hypothetical protein
MVVNLRTLGTPVVVVPGFPFPTSIRESQPSFSIGTTVATLLQNNADRVFWYAENLGGFQARAGFNRQVTVSYGRLIDSAGGWMSAQLDEDGETVGWEVFAIANGGTTGFYVCEVVRVISPQER